MMLIRSFLVLAFVSSMAAPAVAAADVKKGEALLTRDCSRCHAVGLTGNSPRGAR